MFGLRVGSWRLAHRRVFLILGRPRTPGPLGGSSSRSSRQIPCVSEQPGITTGTYFFKALEQDYIFFSYIFSNRCLWDGTSHLV